MQYWCFCHVIKCVNCVLEYTSATTSVVYPIQSIRITRLQTLKWIVHKLSEAPLQKLPFLQHWFWKVFSFEQSNQMTAISSFALDVFCLTLIYRCDGAAPINLGRSTTLFFFFLKLLLHMLLTLKIVQNQKKQQHTLIVQLSHCWLKMSTEKWKKRLRTVQNKISKLLINNLVS